MRTVVYIDGYNLYYGLLRGTNLKWLDLVTLFGSHVLDSTAAMGESEIAKVAYAMADAMLAARQQ